MTSFMSRRQVLTSGASGALALAGGLPALGASSVAATVEAAKAEKGLTWYDHYDRKEVDSLTSAFRAAFPAVKGVEFIDVPSAQKAARIVQESMAGGPTSDIILNDPSGVQELANRGYVGEANWKDLGVEVSPLTSPSPRMVLVTTAVYVVLYNTNLVKDAEAPQTWDQVVDPKWAGRTGHWMRAAEFPQLIPTMGEAAVKDLGRRMAALKPRLFDGLFPLAQAIGSGEVAMGVTGYDSAVRAIETGAPVKMAALDVTPANLLYGAPLKFGAAPNSAKLFLSWLAQPGGGLAFEKATKRGNLFLEGTETAKFLKGRKVAYIDPEKSVQDAVKIRALETEIGRMLQGRG